MPNRSTTPRKKTTAQPRALASPATETPRGASEFCVVGIGASAGGLDACRSFLDTLPVPAGVAFILVQHLDPTHDSMLVELLSSHTTLTVRQASEGEFIQRDHLYVIPPGTYLSVRNGALHVSPPQAPHGSRMPFDFLLHSLAEYCTARAICVVLSGTGADGTVGIRHIKEKGGFVIAQDPDEAGYDGMPRNAIMTGCVDVILPLRKIPEAIADFARQRSAPDSSGADPSGADNGNGSANSFLAQITELLRKRTPHDFTLYKPGTLQRRIAQRIAAVGLQPSDSASYMNLLRSDSTELAVLAASLLINVTSFFRDRKVFKHLEEKIIPALVRAHPVGKPLRIWVAGCSTGQETYSLSMLFREAITAAKLDIKLQVFASDADETAVALARDGLYPGSIEEDVSPARLARFFSREDDHYRVSAELRAAVVFTVQDVLTDAPFSRLDFVSCRNLLIYLKPEAQAKVIALFHFALREGGILLLGSAETIGTLDGRFDVISKSDRLYRHVGRSRPGELGFLIAGTEAQPFRGLAGFRPQAARQALMLEACRRRLLEIYSPAAVIVNQRREIVYSFGATAPFLRLPQGAPTQELLSLVREDLRTKLRSALQRANQGNGRVSVPGGIVTTNGLERTFTIEIHHVPSDGQELLLVCFVEGDAPERRRGRIVSPQDTSRVAELERELAATRTELRDAISNLEVSNDEQRAINEDALSVQEEYQSTNEELLTSKEELQSLNEELTALNSQLQETLERQRTTSNDLQNVLYSTDVATIFLDKALHIRFFNPATKLLFSVIPGDVGRPLADLNFVSADVNLLNDASKVLQTLQPIEHEIDAHNGTWYMRRIMPYRTQDNQVEGVVITFADVTARYHTAAALRAAKRQAELANVAKSRFLAAASHDLRQPLQTLALLQGLLAKAVTGGRAEKLVARLDDTLGTMAAMLNTLLDINQIEAGTIRPDIFSFPINDLLTRLRDQFAYHAQAQGLDLRILPSSLIVHSDPRLLEQMIRNLLSNALKYTKRGRVLLGCRRQDSVARIEIWDTGIGIPAEELQAIFEEYHQLDNPAREQSHGLGLGLSIVRRLGDLLGHRIRVQSNHGRGSVFAIDVARGQAAVAGYAKTRGTQAPLPPPQVALQGRTILIVEDDPEVRECLELSLLEAGFRVLPAPDAPLALEVLAREGDAPELILADYNLPGGMNGLALAVRLREQYGLPIPAIILTGDISASTLTSIETNHCARMSKPVKIDSLTHLIQRLLLHPASSLPEKVVLSTSAGTPTGPIVFLVDDDDGVRATLRSVLEDDGRIVEDFASAEDFIAAIRPGMAGCLLVDAYLPGMHGIELLEHLHNGGHSLPAIMITGNSDVAMAVKAMKAGASDFIEKPVNATELLAGIDRVLEQLVDSGKLVALRDAAAAHLADLTERQREIMTLVLDGKPSKNIAADLGISQRTVENHRASIMRKTGAKSLPALARLALAAAWREDGTVSK